MDFEEHSNTLREGDSEAFTVPIVDEQATQGRPELAVYATSPSQPPAPIPEEEAWKTSPNQHSHADRSSGSAPTDSLTKYDNEHHEEALSGVIEANTTIPPSSRCSSTMFEMSCEHAADIIVGMRGDDDLDVARSELGCMRGNLPCNVKNVRVLQILDF
jgi:hypothetical protein